VELDRDGGAVAAEKGSLREIGSLAFHWAFLLLLVGVIVGKGTGFTGRAVIVEGTTWTDAQANYDGRIRAGRFFSGGFTGMQIHLNDFQDEYRTSGVPMDFVSHVDFVDADGTPIRSEDISVNHPAGVEGLRVFQYGFGWAPAIEVRGRDGQVLHSDTPIPMVQDQAPDGVSQLAMPWHGFVKLPSLRPQMAIELELWPDGRAFFQSLQTGQPQPMVEAVEPLLRYRVWRGSLTDLSLSSLDTAFMRRGASGFLGRGQTVDLDRGCLVGGAGLGGDNGDVDDRPGCPKGPVGFRMSFPELRQYSVLQVSRDAGVPLVLGAAILILVGLLPALYTSRRKVWVRTDPAGEGSVLKVGGFALQRKGQFDAEFAKLVAALVAAAGGERREEPIVRPAEQSNEEPKEETVAP
jgi:cytochrome c biogenesis protein